MNLSFMREAIRLSIQKMREENGGPFGAIVVRGEEILGTGWNQVTRTNDPTSHAEMNAIREACRRIKNFRLDGCEIYSSCEPCPMCLGAIYWARLERLWFAANRSDAAAVGFDDEIIYREIATPLKSRVLPATQLLREEALAAFAEWKSFPEKTPY